MWPSTCRNFRPIVLLIIVQSTHRLPLDRRLLATLFHEIHVGVNLCHTHGVLVVDEVGFTIEIQSSAFVLIVGFGTCLGALRLNSLIGHLPLHLTCAVEAVTDTNDRLGRVWFFNGRRSSSIKAPR